MSWTSSRLVTLSHAHIAGSCINISLTPIHECVRLGDIVDVGSGTHHRMDQARVGVSADVRLHSVVPLIALFGLMHFRVKLAGAVLGRVGCGDDGGIDHGAALQHEAFGFEYAVDRRKELLGHIVTLHQVAKAQDADPVGQAISVSQSGKAAVKRGIKQRFFHGEVAQSEQLLQQMQTQHGLMCKWRASSGLGRCHDRKLRYELTPRHNAFHEFKQFHLARAPGAQVQIKGSLVHARIVASTVGVAHASGEF